MNGHTDSSTGAAPRRTRVELGERSYDVIVGSGVLDVPASYGTGRVAGQAVIVTNVVVGPLLAERAIRALRHRFDDVHVVTLPDGEDSKRWDTLNTVFDALVRLGCDRGTTLVALGGGVVGDITGFAAASYMRGIDFIQLPTTLLAQVDSSVGGKTGINHPAGKNMIGAFHQPRLVVADVGLLATLPRREFVAGLAEVIKYGAAIDPVFLDWIDANLDRLLALDADALIHAVHRSCELKAEVVAGDEREAGRRALLNFGHTFGHAIEVALGYGTWLHGEAVGCGMVLAARLSATLGRIDAQRARRIEDIVSRAGLPTRLPAVPPARLVELMHADKKSLNGELRFVLLDGASGATLSAVDPARVLQVMGESAAT